jgi:hypothetical protein
MTTTGTKAGEKRFYGDPANGLELVDYAEKSRKHGETLDELYYTTDIYRVLKRENCIYGPGDYRTKYYVEAFHSGCGFSFLWKEFQNFADAHDFVLAA